jgi:hypothetical protein
MSGLVSINDDNPKSYDEFMDWYDTFAQFCPFYIHSLRKTAKVEE